MDEANEEISCLATSRAIKEFIEKSEYSLETIQYFTGLARTTLYNYQNNKTQPTIPNLRRLCRLIFECPYSELIKRAEEIEKEIIKDMNTPKRKKRKKKS